MAEPATDIATPRTAPAAKARPPSVGAGVAAAVAVALAVLLVASFEPAMGAWPTSLTLLLIVPLAALLLFGCSLWSVSQLLRIPADGLKFAAPAAICALTWLVLFYVPLQQIWLQRDFRAHHATRERIVARVESGELVPNVASNNSLIALDGRDSGVSAGNTIVIDEADEGTYVLFVISRGLGHSFSGFLRVPPGADAVDFSEFDDKPPGQVVRYDKEWYFVAK